MLSWLFKKKESDSSNSSDAATIASGYAVTGVAQNATQAAAEKFTKPVYSKATRPLYDSRSAKEAAKRQAFADGKVVRDPYTGDVLVATQDEAKILYGAEWTKHAAESDHVIPLKRVYDKTKDDVWLTSGDIAEVGNKHMRVVSRHFNDVKGDHLNSETVNREKGGIKVSKKGAQTAIHDENVALESIKSDVHKARIKNIVNTGHAAGVQGAKYAGGTTATIVGIQNVVDVIRGDKDVGDAIADTVKAGGQAAAAGYVMSGGLTVVSHTLSNSSSAFIKGLVKSNVPGKVITAVTVTGNTLKRYANGEITTQECLLELGSKGLNMATAGYAMAIGQAVIPIPVVGGAIGALVGSVLTGNLYENLIQTLQTQEHEHQERLRIIEECHRTAEQAKAYREEMEIYIRDYFSDYRSCFDEALSSIRFAYQAGDPDGMIAAANRITRKLGGKVHYDTVEGFKNYLTDGIADTL